MTVRTHEQLASALSCLADEVFRCAECSARRTRALEEEDAVVADACLEAMLVHARAVLMFLLNDSGFPTDIRRSDFTVSDWAAPGGETADLARAEITLINKHLAHLTWDRVDPSVEPWDETGFAEKVVALATSWVDHLSLTDESLATVVRPWLLFSKQSLGLVTHESS